VIKNCERSEQEILICFANFFQAETPEEQRPQRKCKCSISFIFFASLHLSELCVNYYERSEHAKFNSLRESSFAKTTEEQRSQRLIALTSVLSYLAENNSTIQQLNPSPITKRNSIHPD
jgi:hypothetical protein